MSKKSKPVVGPCAACQHYKLTESQLLSKKFRVLTKEPADGRYHLNNEEFREPFVVQVTQRSPRCCMHAVDWVRAGRRGGSGPKSVRTQTETKTEAKIRTKFERNLAKNEEKFTKDGCGMCTQSIHQKI